MNKRYVMCIDNRAYPADLALHKVYAVIPDAGGEKHGMIRIVDETGEDYLFEANLFVPVELSEAAAEAFQRVPA